MTYDPSKDSSQVVPELQLQDEFVLEREEAARLPTGEVSGVEENAPAAPGEVDYDTTKTSVDESVEISAPFFGPTEDNFVAPGVAVGHLLVMLTSLALFYKVGTYVLSAGTVGERRVAPREVPFDNLAEEWGGATQIPEQFLKGTFTSRMTDRAAPIGRNKGQIVTE
eukprot:CAMPEP_0170747218 /NCGR_PEP_ID=MMETSP0437-20130122/9207_1 /TAXON_ID=0 /ORGANISM="Sexangularia sp." /LENGTH=166 /DNA_ID=CAMNT_0011085985 /DNA_START=225 /DNA_END=725 /DNA_ORIENTATION=-